MGGSIYWHWIRSNICLRASNTIAMCFFPLPIIIVVVVFVFVYQSSMQWQANVQINSMLSMYQTSIHTHLLFDHGFDYLIKWTCPKWMNTFRVVKPFMQKRQQIEVAITQWHHHMPEIFCQSNSFARYHFSLANIQTVTEAVEKFSLNEISSKAETFKCTS